MLLLISTIKSKVGKVLHLKHDQRYRIFESANNDLLPSQILATFFDHILRLYSETWDQKIWVTSNNYFKTLEDINISQALHSNLQTTFETVFPR